LTYFPRTSSAIRAQLSMVLEGILCQALLLHGWTRPRDGDGNPCAKPAIRNLIREDNSPDYSAMQTGTSQTGMQTSTRPWRARILQKRSLWTWRFRALRIQTSCRHDQPRSNGPTGGGKAPLETIRVLRQNE